MFAKLGRRRAAVAAALVAVVAFAVAAYAYFTSSGSGTGSASVGTASPWGVSVGSPTGGPLYPGAGSEDLAYTITNGSSGHQQLETISAAVASSGGNITHNGTAVAGCSASWFTAVNHPPSLPSNVAGGGSRSGSVTVTMQDSNTNQDACKNASPDITVNTPAAAGPPPPSGDPTGTFSGTAGSPLAFTVAPTGDSGTLNPASGEQVAIDTAGHSPPTLGPRCTVSYLSAGGSHYYFGLGANMSSVSCHWTLTINGTEVPQTNGGIVGPGPEGRASTTFDSGDSVSLSVEVHSV
jgi:hypothetical protein